jgi:hypothetical protein
VKKEFPDYQRAFADLEVKVADKCLKDWNKPLGYLTPTGDECGRTTIIPALFRGWAAAAPYPQLAHWRQHITATGHQPLLMGMGGGNVIPKDFKVAWMGLMFPNKQMQITEIKWQISDRKYGRINLEEIRNYNKPAIIFEEGFILNEKQSFDLYGYVEEADYQRIIMLGAAYYKVIDRVLGAPGAAITEE